MNTTDREIEFLVRAKFPIIEIVTYEESRVLEKFLGAVRPNLTRWRQEQLGSQLERAGDEEEKTVLAEQLARLNSGQAHPILRWSYTDGLFLWSNYVEDEEGVERWRPRKVNVTGEGGPTNPLNVLRFLRGAPQETAQEVDFRTAVVVFCDLHPWLDREDRMGRFNHMIVRTLRDLTHEWKFSPEPRAIVLLTPKTVLPLELSKDIQVIDYPLPTVDQLTDRFTADKPGIKHRYGDDSIQLNEDGESQLVRALTGLTYDEAENVLAKSLVKKGCLDDDAVREAMAEKRQIIRKDGTLEFFESDKDFNQIGGLELLGEWLDLRQRAFVGDVVDVKGKEIPLPKPKGILLIGVPGGGKSLVAKSVGTAWQLPLLRFDIGRIFEGIVGKSEENMRRAIAIAESVAPTVVWLDEVEKAFPKVSGSLDSGVSLRVMNTFLTWMQEKQASVFVVATGNDISQMPPELTRKGRFDEIFYVGLPDLKARQEIFKIHTRDLQLSDQDITYLAEKARWYTGAEIEQVVKNALYAVQKVLGKQPKPGEPDNPLTRAIAWCMEGERFVPLAQRRSKDGQGLLANTLKQARLMAAPASKHFEDLPEDGDDKAPHGGPSDHQRF